MLRQFMTSDNPLAQAYKGLTGVITGLIATISPNIEQADAIVRLIGGAAAAFCSVAMAVGLVVGWVRGRKKA